MYETVGHDFIDVIISLLGRKKPVENQIENNFPQCQGSKYQGFMWLTIYKLKD